jgi:WS/DGAT/MGAT family acyltransferase
MAYSHYDRLTALDATFLELEDPNVHMHVGSVGIFDARPLRKPDGGIDIDRICALSESALRRHPRFRQKLAYIPLLNHPVWVDDHRFNLSYHLRHTSLGIPGDVRRLKRLAGRIMSQKLDRGKPLWEMWFVDGVEDDRFAVITKIHHCMIDGLSGVDLMSSLMRADPDAGVGSPHPWIPRPVPGPYDLLRGELRRRLSLPLDTFRAGRRAVAQPSRTYESIVSGIEGVGEAIWAGLKPASPTPLNPAIGPHRRFDWARVDLDAVKQIKSRLGGTINDVVLAVVAGTIRRFLRGRGLRVEDLDFRSMVPVSIRAPSERGRLGNRVSFLLARLPLDEKDPRERLRRVIETTHELKDSKEVQGAEIIEQISDWTFTSLFVQFTRLAAQALSYNMVVTNVPGPQFPVYLLGAKMLETYPLVPLFSNQALGIALFSYDGGLFWGFNSDWDALPDLHEIVEALEQEFASLAKAAEIVPITGTTAQRRSARHGHPRRRVKRAAKRAPA